MMRRRSICRRRCCCCRSCCLARRRPSVFAAAPQLVWGLPRGGTGLSLVLAPPTTTTARAPFGQRFCEGDAKVVDIGLTLVAVCRHLGLDGVNGGRAQVLGAKCRGGALDAGGDGMVAEYVPAGFLMAHCPPFRNPFFFFSFFLFLVLMLLMLLVLMAFLNVSIQRKGNVNKQVGQFGDASYLGIKCFGERKWRYVYVYV